VPSRGIRVRTSRRPASRQQTLPTLAVTGQALRGTDRTAGWLREFRRVRGWALRAASENDPEWLPRGATAMNALMATGAWCLMATGAGCGVGAGCLVPGALVIRGLLLLV
jgi:hypothetical protein